MDNTLREQKIASEQVWSGVIFDVYRDEVVLKSGKQTKRDYVVHHGGAGILPVDAHGNCYLVRQWRYPQDEAVLEIPAGKVEPGEDAYQTAIRELEEEVGFRAGTILNAGVLYPSPAYVREMLHIYLATDLTPVPSHLDEGEFLEIVKLPLDEAVALVYANQIHDAKTQVALLKAKHMLGMDKK